MYFKNTFTKNIYQLSGVYYSLSLIRGQMELCGFAQTCYYFFITNGTKRTKIYLVQFDIPGYSYFSSNDNFTRM